MKTNDKIKELIKEYLSKNSYIQYHPEDIVRVLETLLEPECKHENTTYRGNKDGGLNVICDEYDKLIKEIR